MTFTAPSTFRNNKLELVEADFVIVGGGLAGTCAAVTAARAGVKVVLVQDRPVLGGNASSEVRLWALGATSHMGNNNRWSREGGVIDEILLDNLYRNREGNAVIFDTILLDKVAQEPNIRLLLNTAVFAVSATDGNRLRSVEAFCSQNSTQYRLSAPLFCDASGDGIVGFNAGAAFRAGSEAAGEFGEKLAPPAATEDRLGHTLFFYSKREPFPVSYIAPSYARRDIESYPRFKDLAGDSSGCRLWWIEYGGNRDTVYEAEDIKWELWRVVYGIWDRIKNSGEFEDVECLTLEWVGLIAGKRESRRFDGHYILRQQDVVEQTQFPDAVAHGGWAIDIHPPEGVFSAEKPCSQWHSKGVYQIPYRCYISKDIENLFFAGRLISATHIAFGSTRVMLTCALGGQAVGMAAARCVNRRLLPAQLLDRDRMRDLQNRLNAAGQSIPGIPYVMENELMRAAQVSVSSALRLERLAPSRLWRSLDSPIAQLLPLDAGILPAVTLTLRARRSARLTCLLSVSDKPGNYTPNIDLAAWSREITAGQQDIEIDFGAIEKPAGYAFLIVNGSADIDVMLSEQRVTGIVSVFNHNNAKVSNFGKQVVDDDIGIEEFQFWTPERRPGGHNLALGLRPAPDAFGAANLVNGYTRPWLGCNAWVADFDDPAPCVTISWDRVRTVRGVRLHFDTDFDHALESVLMSHPEDRMPFCVKRYRIRLPDNTLAHVERNNYQTLRVVEFDRPVETDALVIEVDHPSTHVPAALFAVECYAP